MTGARGESAGPLDGLRVVDLSLAMAGPFAGQKLGDLGANVVKVEPTGAGEWQRIRGAGNVQVNLHNVSFLGMNRNKRSLSVNLKAPEGLDIVTKLVRQSDVVLVNYRPGVADRLGVGYGRLREENPRIIYCSISGFGERGPEVQRPGQDILLQGYSGVMWNGGIDGGPPVALHAFVADVMAAHMAIEGILAALLSRERSGVGQKVEVNLLSGLLDLQVHELSAYLATERLTERPREPLAHALMPGPYGVYGTKDGFVALAMGDVSVLGDVLDDDVLRGWGTWEAAWEHRDEIYRRVADALPSRTTTEWLEALQARGLWAAPVLNYDQVVANPQVAANEMIVERMHPTEGRLRMLGIPIQFSATPGSIRRHAPSVGEHTSEILRELGYEDDAVTRLAEQGVVQTWVQSGGAERVTE